MLLFDEQRYYFRWLVLEHFIFSRSAARWESCLVQKSSQNTIQNVNLSAWWGHKRTFKRPAVHQFKVKCWLGLIVKLALLNPGAVMLTACFTASGPGRKSPRVWRQLTMRFPEWPSPDLNSLVAWTRMNITELKQSCKMKWSKIPPDLCAVLICKDTKCSVAVLAEKGSLTSY